MSLLARQPPCRARRAIFPNLVGSLAREPTHDDIARRAYQLYEERGREHGGDREDWFQAERELRWLALHHVGDSILTTGSAYAFA